MTHRRARMHDRAASLKPLLFLPAWHGRMTMLAYIARRLLGAIPTLAVIVALSFLMTRLAPGGPFDEEQALPPEIRANLEAAYGLDQPLAVAVRPLRCRTRCAAISGRRSSSATSRSPN